jgi:nitrile hydratase subunit beta
MTGRFKTGERVKVKAIYPPGHVRTPWFLRGRAGEIAEVLGRFGNPEDLAYGRPAGAVTLYRVRFAQGELWPDAQNGPGDTLVADIYEHWLEPAAGDRR